LNFERRALGQDAELQDPDRFSVYTVSKANQREKLKQSAFPVIASLRPRSASHIQGEPYPFLMEPAGATFQVSDELIQSELDLHMNESLISNISMKRSLLAYLTS
jgi:hypothetical protein